MATDVYSSMRCLFCGILGSFTHYLSVAQFCSVDLIVSIDILAIEYPYKVYVRSSVFALSQVSRTTCICTCTMSGEVDASEHSKLPNTIGDVDVTSQIEGVVAGLSRCP